MMLKRQIKRREIVGVRAVKMMANVRASVVALNDEDLLDLADIFRSDANASLMKWAKAEWKGATCVCDRHHGPLRRHVQS